MNAEMPLLIIHEWSVSREVWIGKWFNEWMRECMNDWMLEWGNNSLFVIYSNKNSINDQRIIKSRNPYPVTRNSYPAPPTHNPKPVPQYS
jgi:hypothetical protein